MKKALFLGLGLLLLKFHAQAQSSFVQPVVFGLKAGINTSLFTEDVDAFDPVSSSNDPSFKRFLRISGFGGITVDYMLTERFSVGAEILYNSRGMAYRRENNNVLMIGRDGVEQVYSYFKYNIDYLELPLTASYNVLAVASDNWLTGYAGLAPAITVNKGVKLDHPEVNAGPSDGEPDQYGKLAGVRPFNTSLLAGVQFGSVPSFIGVFADLRANYTLLPVFSGDSNVDGDNMDTGMLSFSLGLGIKF